MLACKQGHFRAFLVSEYQRFSKWVPGLAVLAPPGNLLEKENLLGLSPNLLNQQLEGWSSAIYSLISLLGNSDTQENLWTTETYFISSYNHSIWQCPVNKFILKEHPTDLALKRFGFLRRNHSYVLWVFINKFSDTRQTLHSWPRFSTPQKFPQL